jgi:hypothetical protein
VLGCGGADALFTKRTAFEIAATTSKSSDAERRLKRTAVLVGIIVDAKGGTESERIEAGSCDISFERERDATRLDILATIGAVGQESRPNRVDSIR